MACVDCSYSYDFIESLQNKINTSLANSINRENASRKRDLNICFNDELYLKLSRYNVILDKVKNCSNCYQGMNIANIVDAIQTNLNKL